MVGKGIVFALALAALPAVATAQSDRQDTTARRGRGEAQSGRRVESRGGDVSRPARRGRASRSSYGLSRDQIRELQQALGDAGCDAGTPDGVIGPRTRRAMACARQQKGLQGNDMGELLRALDLDFADQVDTTGDVMRSGRSGGGRRDSTGAMRLGRDAQRDSTQDRDSTQRDSTRRPPQRGRVT